MTVKITHFLLSLVVVASSSVVAEEVQVAQVKFNDHMINYTTNFVESTVNMITTPFLSDQDVECLARNIFYEAGSEPIEGKVAVGMVTINRVQDPKYPKTVCGVVRQRTVETVLQKTDKIKTVKPNIFSPPKTVIETESTWVQKAVCQFSWTCQKNIKIRDDDPRWVESKQVAENISRGAYPDLREKYSDAMHFHAVYVKPGWKLKKIARIGNHVFYE